MNLHSSSVQQHDAYPLLFLMMCITPSELDHQQKPRKATPQPGEDTLNSHLPPGWQSYMSPQGRRYYVNTFTNETTWERPSSVPGTPKSPVTQQSPAVNGYHISGTPVHQLDSAHMNLRKASGDPQTPGSPAAPRRQSKESSLTINCVTFPHPDIMPEQQLLKPSEWSYCDYFWADKKDSQGNNTVSGFEILLQKQLKGKQMQKEMAEFVRERIKIEEEYAKNLSKLSQNSLAAQEEGQSSLTVAQANRKIGHLWYRGLYLKLHCLENNFSDRKSTLGEAWAQLKKSLADEAEVHLKFSSKLQSEVEKPLLNFRENFKKDMKKCDHHIADLRKQLASRYAAVEKARKALTERQKDLEMKTQQLEVKLSNKTEEEIKKARRKSTQAGDDLMRCVDLYNQAQSKWFEEMVTTTLELERLEVERVEMIRQHLCQYTQLRHETDMFNQSTVELVDQLLRKVDPAKDRELWVKEHKTGDIRPVDMEI
ncbi:growth arrest-specific protein 7 isoform X4 [Gallus gallus]|uniref:growth arrest-specific protein 7 isoform X4 n=1 Tax=Gallus gallus TaxID=9031 RepID=UPI000739CF48|nr:growth arrest-specific protein 7 isoform X4 [Gallus gallus]XP_046758038.1 growth arrest-specific protein 7 isoform X4 [Gallus gallus]XP_046785659.1 growth arrest-specific protein 7 isoform X4 [Gallus gallus]XP_046785660.1 growth arrest-specific protein 7 isoform X4 [Gallus gallus]|eukprot:XP_015150701.1 growth arrest-specific protein 7 isoform X4 [Gallus gallus]